jgi:hypothetical protein
MWPRWCFALTLLVALFAFSITLVSANTAINPYPVGRAALSASGSSVTGEAIILRQVTAGTTHVMVRLSGVSTSSAPVWRIESGGGGCRSSISTPLLTESAPARVTSVNISMTADTYSATLPVTWGSSGMMVCVYDGSATTGPLIVSGGVFDQPSLTGSSHWW